MEKTLNQSEYSDVHEECKDWKCTDCNPPPPTHPEYGPPVYDPYFKCWTYPYAQNKPKIVVKEQPSPEKKAEVHSIEC